MPPSRAGLLLALILIMDIVLPSTFGTVPGQGCIVNGANCSFGLPFFVQHVWPLTPQGPASAARFYMGESCFDLFVIACVRAAIFAVLCLSLAVFARPVVSPLLEPLQVEGFPVTEEFSHSRVLACSLSARVHRVAGRAIASVGLVYSSAKAFARLMQSGYGHGATLGLLYVPGTTPPEFSFWLCVGGAALLSEIECRIHNLLVSDADARGIFGGRRADTSSTLTLAGWSGNGKDDAKSVADEAADAAKQVKTAYLKRTDPPKEEVRSMRYCMQLMSLDAHLLAVAYISLIVAAAGESAVPYLYGKVMPSVLRGCTLHQLSHLPASWRNDPNLEADTNRTTSPPKRFE